MPRNPYLPLEDEDAVRDEIALSEGVPAVPVDAENAKREGTQLDVADMIEGEQEGHQGQTAAMQGSSRSSGSTSSSSSTSASSSSSPSSAAAAIPHPRLDHDPFARPVDEILPARSKNPDQLRIMAIPADEEE